MGLLQLPVFIILFDIHFYLKESSSVHIFISPRSSLRHVIMGVGLPSAWQLRVTLIPSLANVSALLASSTMFGGT